MSAQNVLLAAAAVVVAFVFGLQYGEDQQRQAQQDRDGSQLQSVLKHIDVTGYESEGIELEKIEAVFESEPVESVEAASNGNCFMRVSVAQDTPVSRALLKRSLIDVFDCSEIQLTSVELRLE